MAASISTPRRTRSPSTSRRSTTPGRRQQDRHRARGRQLHPPPPTSASSDPSDSPANALLAVKIGTCPAPARWTRRRRGESAGEFVSAADIAAGAALRPAANANGAGYAGFSFQVRDNGGIANGGVDLDPTPNTITIDVTAVNDAPEIAINTSPSPKARP